MTTKLYKLTYIEEPSLTFGYEQKIIDPRDGLTLFGPYTRNEIQYQSPPIGIIGADVSRKRLISWIEKARKPVNQTDDSIARPYFPGIEATYNFDINIDAIVQLEVSQDAIDKYLQYFDDHQRIHNLVNLYADALIKYQKQEERPVLVWLVVIPDSIYQHCRPKSRIPKEGNINIGLPRKSRTELLLFEEDRALQEAYKYEKNFHNQLKAKLLESRIVTQVIRESTIAYAEIKNEKGKLQRDLRKFESAIAWSLSTALYYKIGGLPWKLGEVRKDVCYVGLVYKRVENNSNDKYACCAAQMFLDSGDGLVFRGNLGPWYNPDKKEFHLNREGSADLIQKALETFKEKNNAFPKEIFIHAKTYFSDEEWKGFEEGSQGKSKLVGIRIRDDYGFKLYREFPYPVPRGMSLMIDNKNAFLWTKGYVSRLQSPIGMETPNPLSIEVTRDTADIETVCRDVLALTKLNYNACIYGDGVPVTLRFADAIGEILTAGPMKNIGVLPFKHYI